MRRAALTLTALALALVLAACSPIDRGTVTGKSHDEALWIPVTSCVPSGKSTVCTTSMQYTPPSWKLYLRNEDKTGWAYVDEGTWDAYEVGDFYPSVNR